MSKECEDISAQDFTDKLESIFKEKTVAELETKIKNIEYEIREKENLLKKSGHLLDENSKRAIQISIERNRRSLDTASEAYKKKLEWYVEQAIREEFRRLVKCYAGENK